MTNKFVKIAIFWAVLMMMNNNIAAAQGCNCADLTTALNTVLLLANGDTFDLSTINVVARGIASGVESWCSNIDAYGFFAELESPTTSPARSKSTVGVTSQKKNNFKRKAERRTTTSQSPLSFLEIETKQTVDASDVLFALNVDFACISYFGDDSSIDDDILQQNQNYCETTLDVFWSGVLGNFPYTEANAEAYGNNAFDWYLAIGIYVYDDNNNSCSDSW